MGDAGGGDRIVGSLYAGRDTGVGETEGVQPAVVQGIEAVLTEQSEE